MNYPLWCLMSCSMRSPSRLSAAGFAIHANMLGGIQAGSVLMGQLAGSFRLKAKYLPLDSSSASSEPVLEQQVIFSIATVQPAAVATVLIALTRVEQRLQRVLYPFHQMPTEPALSTQIRTGRPLHVAWSADTQISGPTSSRADIFLHSLRPSVCFAPELIFRPQGTRNQKRPPMPPELCPGDRADPPEASV